MKKNKTTQKTIKLYNTASRSVENFEPLETGKVRLYACGLTVYDYTHLGHLRKYMFDDVLVRVLRQAGYQVQHVQNITDVGHLASDGDTGEDKLEKGAKKYGKSAWDIAREFEEYFWYSMDAVNVSRPNVSCRATEHIPGQLAMVQQLEKLGYAYVIEDDGVYFDTSKFADYGKMARINLDKQEAGASVEVIPGKRNPSDFALWKFERAGENRAMVWPSPWHPRSFPGWHIECSAMAQEYLGDQLDIHTGGIDHIPVHHTNEIAQAEAATAQKPFVKYWVHHNFLRISGEKMSKSLGNFFTIDDVKAKGFEPLALRLLYLTAHYRSEFNFTWENLEGMNKKWLKLKKQVLELRQKVDSFDDQAELNAEAQEFEQKFWQALYNDLNTAEALAVLWHVIKSDLAADQKLLLLRNFDTALGIGVSSWIENSEDSRNDKKLAHNPKITELLLQRDQARAAKDWALADKLRDQLVAMGVEVVDQSLAG